VDAQFGLGNWRDWLIVIGCAWCFCEVILSDDLVEGLSDDFLVESRAVPDALGRLSPIELVGEEAVDVLHDVVCQHCPPTLILKLIKYNFY
jgi:hypothetical protein